jgi:hypothetical protein
MHQLGGDRRAAGHASMTMTMTYARIADRTLAQEYFAVDEKTEALYEPAPPPADAEGRTCAHCASKPTGAYSATATAHAPTNGLPLRNHLWNLEFLRVGDPRVVAASVAAPSGTWIGR